MWGMKRAEVLANVKWGVLLMHVGAIKARSRVEMKKRGHL